MTPSVTTELRKLRFTRSLWALPAIGLAIALAGAVGLISALKAPDIPARLSEYGPLRFGTTNFGLLLAALGVRLFADETHHCTLVPTLLREPRRARVLGAKVATVVGASLAFCTLVYLAVVPITVAGLRARDLDMAFDVGATAALFARVAAAMALLGVLGVAVGAVIRNRTVAIVTVIVWFALAEDALGGLLHIRRFLPGAAATGLVAGGRAGELLATPLAALVLTGFVLVALLAATAALRRDVA